MPIDNYSLLVGKAVDMKLASGENPHYSILVVDTTKQYRVAVNVQSDDGSEVEYAIFNNWNHPLKDDLKDLQLGIYNIGNFKSIQSLDYIRDNLADPCSFVHLPMNVMGPNNDLNEKVNQYVWRAIADQKSKIYAFGSAWGPDQPERDKIFGFFPGNGIHDIHMNQGDDSHIKDNGVWQDGGLIFHFGYPEQWVAIFLRFKNQSWRTNDVNGNSILVPITKPDSTTEQTEFCPGSNVPIPYPQHKIIKIIAALVNDADNQEKDTVTILNTSNKEMSLEDWSITDRQKYKLQLDGSIGRGSVKVVPLNNAISLSNKGDIITLYDDQGIKVDGVSYSQLPAKKLGWTITF
jgi:uncharacterized protein YukJ